MTKTSIATKHDEQLNQFFEKQLESINYWLSFAEAKNGALIAINVALMAVIISIFDKAPIFCVISIICYVISSTVCLISFIPNTNSRPDANNQEAKEDINLVFYGDIEKVGTPDKYIELIIRKYYPDKEKYDKNKYIYDLASEILINSRIASKKYKYFKNGVKIDFISLIATILFLCAA